MILTEMEIGEIFTTDSRTVTKGDVDAFCRVTGAGEAIFVDDETARAAGLKGRVVPGSLTLVTTLGLLEDFTEGLLLAGMDKVRFESPVFIGDTITVESEVIEARSSKSIPDAGILKFRNTVKNQNNENIATWETALVVRRKPKKM